MQFLNMNQKSKMATMTTFSKTLSICVLEICYWFCYADDTQVYIPLTPENATVNLLFLNFRIVYNMYKEFHYGCIMD